MAIRQPIKDIGKQTALYGFGNVLSKFAAFFLIPVYTRYLSTLEVGVLALLEMAEFILITLLPMGMINALWRYLPSADQLEKRRTVATAFWGTLGIGFIILILLILNRHGFASVLSLGESGAIFFLIMSCNVFLFVGSQFILWMMQYDQKPVQYMVISLAKFIGILSFTIYFVIGLEKGIYGVLISKTIVLGMLFIVSSIYVLKTAFIAPRISMLVKMLRYGAPLILVAFVTPVLTFSDRYFLKMFVSLEQIAIYSIAYKFGMLINMLLVVPLQRGWSPMMYRMGIGKDSQVIHKDILFYYAFIGSLLFLTITFFAESILRVFTTDEYLPGVKYIPWVAFAYLVNGFRSFFVAGAALKDKTKSIGKAGFFSIVANLLLNYFLIRQYGVIGAAWSTAISYLLLVLLVFNASQKAIHIDWGLQRLFKLMAITLVLLGIVINMQNNFPDLRLIISMLGLLAFIIATLVTRTVGSREINGIKTLLTQIRNR
ncbi:MAG: oligosaccharide flippase family protein [Candidatus Marinimicrobia bacterium]|nr:oligosaccharide flippase family protein [Candidatus Neomarinimicrobiota bacterium]